MVGAADAVFLVSAKVQRSATVGAELVDQADLAFGIAKREQLLTEDLHTHLRAIRLGNLARQQDRHPVPAHKLAHWGAGAGAHQCFRHFPVHCRAALLAAVSTQRDNSVKMTLPEECGSCRPAAHCAGAAEAMLRAG